MVWFFSLYDIICRRCPAGEVLLVQVVVLPHEGHVGQRQRGHNSQQIPPAGSAGRQQQQAAGNGQLQAHVDGGHGHVRKAELVGHQLVGVLAVGLAKVLAEQQAVHDGQHAVRPVDRQQQDVGEVARPQYQTPEGEDHHQRDADGADVAREAARAAAEVEEAEHQHAEDGHDEQPRVDEAQGAVGPPQREQHRQAVAARDAVDAVHEVVGVHDAHAEHQRGQDSPPGAGGQDAPVGEQQQHGGEVHGQPHLVGNRTNVVREADGRGRRQTREEVRVREAVERRVEPHAQHEDDAAAAERDVRVRAAQVRAVDDAQPKGHAEIQQFQKEKQGEDEGVGQHGRKLLTVFNRPSRARTGSRSTPSARFILALDTT